MLTKVMFEGLENTSKKWIPGLDLLRCTAVFLVLIGHAKTLLSFESRELFKQLLPMPASWGVEIFFSLSGYLIGRSWISINLNKSNGPWHNFVQFTRSRWIRTIPTYWIVLSICIITRLISFQGGSWLNSLIINLTLTNWITSEPYALPVSWTLAMEEFSYLIVGTSLLITHKCIKTLSNKNTIRVLTIFPISLILCGIILRFWNAKEGIFIDIDHNPLLRIDALAYGILLACLIGKNSVTEVSNKIWRGSLIPIAISASLFIIQGVKIDFFAVEAMHKQASSIIFGCILLPSTGIVTALLVVSSTAWTGTKNYYLDGAIKHLARISYSLYLVHIPIRTYMQSHWAANSAQSGIVLFVIYITISILLGDVIYKLFEKPFLDWKKRINSRL